MAELAETWTTTLPSRPTQLPQSICTATLAVPLPWGSGHHRAILPSEMSTFFVALARGYMDGHVLIAVLSPPVLQKGSVTENCDSWSEKCTWPGES
jgi:hypothetical protein